MAGKIGKFVASFIELFNREIKPVGESDIYNNDEDNLYPNRVELVERNSVTALACSNKLKAFITGLGFVNNDFNELVVNPKKNIKGYQFLNMVSNSIGTHRGVWVHVNYSINGDITTLDVLPYKKCRQAKEDSDGNLGKIYYGDWSKKKKIDEKEDKTWFYPFNRDNYLQQMLKDAELKGIDPTDLEAVVKNYRGQVYFLNLDDFEVYPYAWVHSVYNDADTEYRYILYRNTNYRTGFIGKTMIIPNGLDEESRQEFDGAVKKWLGVENTSGVFVINPKEAFEDPSKVIHTISLKGTYDSKQFENDEKAIENKIRKAYLSIPKILIDPEDSFFGSSGESFKEAIKYYNSETKHIRERIAYMMDLFYNGDFTIRELGNDDASRAIINKQGRL